MAVNTPPGLAGEADMTYARAAAHSIAEHLQTPAIVVNKSTMPIGTGDWVQGVLDALRPASRRPWCRTPSSSARARPSPTSTARPRRAGG